MMSLKHTITAILPNYLIINIYKMKTYRLNYALFLLFDSEIEAILDMIDHTTTKHKNILNNDDIIILECLKSKLIDR